MTLRALVADDEAIARRHLVRLLEAHPELEVIAQASDGLEAVQLIESTSPDVVFLDIQMPGLDGFGVLQRLTQQPLIVFTTAHNEYALLAFKENTVDYLLKPIGPEDMERAINKILSRNSSVPPPGDLVAHLLEKLRTPQSQPSQILISVKDTLRPIRFDQIVVLEAKDKWTVVHTVDQVYESQVPLSDIHASLPASQFIRIHRRHVINRQFIRALRRWGNRQLVVELSVPFPDELLVSRRCYDDVLSRMGQIV